MSKTVGTFSFNFISRVSRSYFATHMPILFPFFIFFSLFANEGREFVHDFTDRSSSTNSWYEDHSPQLQLQQQRKFDSHHMGIKDQTCRFPIHFLPIGFHLMPEVQSFRQSIDGSFSISLLFSCLLPSSLSVTPELLKPTEMPPISHRFLSDCHVAWDEFIPIRNSIFDKRPKNPY